MCLIYYALRPCVLYILFISSWLRTDSLGGPQSEVQLGTTSEVINRWRTQLPLGHQDGESGPQCSLSTPLLPSMLLLPCWLINGAHVQITDCLPKDTKADLPPSPSISCHSSWAPEYKPWPQALLKHESMSSFLGHRLLFMDQSTGCHAGFWLSFYTVV